MLNRSLREQPAAMQLVIFLFLWSLMLVLSPLALSLYLKLTMDIPAGQVASFTKNELYKYPSVIMAGNAIAQLGYFLLPALLFAFWVGPSPARFLGLKKPGKAAQVLWVLLLAVSLLFVVSPLATWLKEINLGNTAKALDEQREHMIASYLTHGTAWTTVKSVFLIAVVPAFCEEIFFRGALMKMIHSLVPRWWFSIGFSAIVFAAFHFSITEFVPILIAGVLLGLVYYLTSSLLLSILLHLVFNLLQALGGIYANPAAGPETGNGAVLAVVFLVATAVVAACIYSLFRNKTALPTEWSVAKKPAPQPQWDLDASATDHL